jgi:hypothetical protein
VEAFAVAGKAFGIGFQANTKQIVYAPEESRQGLAGTGRREDEGVLLAGNRGPAFCLRWAWCRKIGLEPGLCGRVEIGVVCIDCILFFYAPANPGRSCVF